MSTVPTGIPSASTSDLDERWKTYRDTHEGLYWLREYANSAGDLNFALSRTNVHLRSLKSDELLPFWYAVMEYALHECWYLRRTILSDADDFDLIVGIEQVAARIMLDMWASQPKWMDGSGGRHIGRGYYKSAAELLLERIEFQWSRLDDRSRKQIISLLDLCIPYYFMIEQQFLTLLDDILDSISIRRPLASDEDAALPNQLSELVGIWRSLTTQFGSNMRVKTALSQRCRGLFREIVELNLLDVDIPVVTAFFEALFNLKVPPILGSEPNIWDEIRGHLASLADDFTRYVQDRDGPSKEYLRNRQPIVLSYLHGAAQRDYRRFPKEVDISIAEVHSGQKMAGNAIDIDVNPQPGIALVTMERHGLARGSHVIVSIEFPMQQGREQIVAIGVVRRVWGDTGVAVVLESSRSQVDRTPTDADPIEHEADGIEKWKRYAMLQTQIK